MLLVGSGLTSYSAIFQWRDSCPVSKFWPAVGEPTPWAVLSVPSLSRHGTFKDVFNLLAIRAEGPPSLPSEQRNHTRQGYAGNPIWIFRSNPARYLFATAAGDRFMLVWNTWIAWSQHTRWIGFYDIQKIISIFVHHDLEKVTSAHMGVVARLYSICPSWPSPKYPTLYQACDGFLER